MSFKDILQTISTAGLRIALIILLAFLADWLVWRSLRKMAEGLKDKAGPRAVTLIKTTRSLAKYAIFFIAAIMILSQLGVQAGPLLAGVGIAGLAIGFGAQSLVKDVVSGFFILLEGQYDVGDVVEINRVMGTVEAVGLRMTRLKDTRGQIHFFANGSIASVNIFPDEGSTYLVHIPSEEKQTDIVGKAVEVILDDFDKEYEAFALAPALIGKKPLSSYAVVLEYRLTLSPSRLTVTLEKLPGRLKTSLQCADLSIPEGTEISILPALSESA